MWLLLELQNKFMQLKNAVAPIVLALAGLIILIFGLTNNQTGLFNLGGTVILVSGVIATLSAMDFFSKSIRNIILIALGVIALVLVYVDYKAIKDPLDFQAEKNRRYAHVIQNLKDIREVEMKYKSKYGKFTGSFDTLMQFIKSDSLLVIKSIGTAPDSLNEAQALEQGFIKRDTTYVPVDESVFNDEYLAERKVPFKLDSLPYVPFTNMAFEIQAGFVERGRVKVPVFLVVDAAPFDQYDVLQVGSMKDPSTSGNWGE